MKKKGILTTVIGMVIIVGIIIFAFLYVGKKGDVEETGGQKSEIEKLISRDLDKDYPATSREVLKLYCRVMKCLFASRPNEEEFKELAGMLCELYDDELLEKNPKEELYANLQKEVDSYHSTKKQITNYVVQNSSAIETKKLDGREYATILASFLMWEKSQYTKTYEKFILRQDEDGRWKILGWKQTEEVEIDEGTE